MLHRPARLVLLLAIACLAMGACRSIAGYSAANGQPGQDGGPADGPRAESGWQDGQVDPDLRDAAVPLDLINDRGRDQADDGSADQSTADVAAPIDAPQAIDSSPVDSSPTDSSPAPDAPLPSDGPVPPVDIALPVDVALPVDANTPPPDLTFFDDATGACHEPKLVVMAANCDQQHVGCSAGDAGDTDCDGIENPLDPSNVCNKLQFQDEASTKWPNALSNGCTVLINSAVTGGTSPGTSSFGNNLWLMRFALDNFTSGSRLQLTAEIQQGPILAKVVAILQANGSTATQLFVRAIKGTTTSESSKTVNSPLAQADYVLALWLSNGVYYAVLYDAQGTPLLAPVLSTGPQVSGAATINVAATGAASVRVDYVRVYDL